MFLVEACRCRQPIQFSFVKAVCITAIPISIPIPIEIRVALVCQSREFRRLCFIITAAKVHANDVAQPKRALQTEFTPVRRRKRRRQKLVQ